MLLYFRGNLDISPLISPSDVVGINELTDSENYHYNVTYKNSNVSSESLYKHYH